MVSGMKIALFCIGFKQENKEELLQLVSEIKERKHRLYFNEELYAFLKSDLGEEKATWSGYQSLSEIQPDFLFSLGGDGTILKSILHVRDLKIPIVGINMGRLGFLANVNKGKMSLLLDRLSHRDYIEEQRTLLHLDSNMTIFSNANFALNDFSILKRDSSSMITVHTYINGKFLNSYWCDGLIVSTPTGSTAYSLSCGGPIIYPDSKSFVITPVAPHNLTVRPLVVPDDSHLSFEVEGRNSEFICTLDGRMEMIGSDHKIAISKEKFGVHLLRFDEEEFVDTIRKKLNWGNDVRNW